VIFNREKKLLVGSDDYGRDLTGVQNLRKKHKRLEAELSSHEPAIQVSVYTPVINRSLSRWTHSCKRLTPAQTNGYLVVRNKKLGKKNYVQLYM